MIKYSKCAIYANVRWQKQRPQHTIQKYSPYTLRIHSYRVRELIHDNSTNTLDINDCETANIFQSVVGQSQKVSILLSFSNGKRVSAFNLVFINGNMNGIASRICSPGLAKVLIEKQLSNRNSNTSY